LENRTEGWAAGLQLAGISMQKQGELKSFIADFSGSHRHILDYLSDEVLRQQPEDIRTFLLHTAILERLSGPLCDVLTGRRDSEKLLAHLEAANLFIIALDEERRWYRYHHLFADLLRSQLVRTQPEMIPALHRRASRWYEENGDIQAAIHHAFQDPDLTLAAHLIEQHAIPELNQGQVARVVSWFDRLPEAVLESAPMLCMGKAWALVLMHRGARRGDVERALQVGEHALDRVNAGEVLRKLVAGHTASIQAYLLQTPSLRDNKPEELIAIAQKALQLLPLDEKSLRSGVVLNIGYGYLALADLEAASLAFKQALDDGLSGGGFYSAIYGPINLVFSALLVGRLEDALQLCQKNIERFNQILARQYFPPVGALYIFKGSILLEYDCLAEAEEELTEGLDLIRWTGETIAHKKGYEALARLRAIQGNRPAMLEAVQTLEESWPEGAIFAQALRYRLLIRYAPDDPGVQKDAYAWLAQSSIKFDELTVFHSVEPVSTAYFDSYLYAAYVLAPLSKKEPGIYPLEGVQDFLKRHQDFAASHGLISWVIEIAIARSLLYQSAGQQDEALNVLEVALNAAASTGFFRIFLDEGEPLRALLKEVRPRLTGEPVIAYTNRLLDAFRRGVSTPETGEGNQELLSGRELEVLQHMARGLSYQEIGQQLFLSLNTVQSHVKNIYRKLLVNKRMQAIEKAREMHLIYP
jgi:LuxR family maltose regulon positive regulatory protein